MLPTDLPPVAIVGVPNRLSSQRMYAEWLCLSLAPASEFALFDPDHLCPPGYFKRPCTFGIELFHPIIGPNPNQERSLIPTATQADTDAPPRASGQVLAYHRYEWHYTGPVTSWETTEATRRPIVQHVIDAPQLTLRLVVDIGGGTILAQLRDPAEAPALGDWVTLTAGRAELVTVDLVSNE